jgi:four helix bundle protein
MEHTDWNVPKKPYDLQERLFLFACLIVRLVQYLHTRGPIAKALSYRVLKSGTSAGANYEEADGGSSNRDQVAKRRIVLRELMEPDVDYDPTFIDACSFLKRNRRLRRSNEQTARAAPLPSCPSELMGFVLTAACLRSTGEREKERTFSWRLLTSARLRRRSFVPLPERFDVTADLLPGAAHSEA